MTSAQISWFDTSKFGSEKYSPKRYIDKGFSQQVQLLNRMQAPTKGKGFLLKRYQFSLRFVQLTIARISKYTF